MTSNSFLYKSCADDCKEKGYGKLTYNNTIDPCKHSPSHLTRDALKNDLVNQYGNGTNTQSRVIWSGHWLDVGEERSISYSEVNAVVMTTDNIIKKESVRSVLLHELSHQLGANDHYCKEDGTPCSNKFCYECNERGKAPKCLMSGFNSFTDYIILNPRPSIYCAECAGTGAYSIPNHLSNHH